MPYYLLLRSKDFSWSVFDPKYPPSDHDLQMNGWDFQKTGQKDNDWAPTLSLDLRAGATARCLADWSIGYALENCSSSCGRFSIKITETGLLYRCASRLCHDFWNSTMRFMLNSTIWTMMLVTSFVKTTSCILILATVETRPDQSRSLRVCLITLHVLHLSENMVTLELVLIFPICLHLQKDILHVL